MAELGGLTSCAGGETVSVQLEATFDTNANVQVLDVGFFVPEPGDTDALEGDSCYRDLLAPLQTQGDGCMNDGQCTGVGTGGDECADGHCYPSAQADGGPYPDVEGDMCGDAPDMGIGPYVYALNGGSSFEVTCSDSDGDNKADLVLCLTWDDDGDDKECTEEADLTPKTTSMCNCTVVQIGDIDVMAPTPKVPAFDGRGAGVLIAILAAAMGLVLHFRRVSSRAS